MSQGALVTDVLQYGSLGLLALMLVGVAWYVKNVEQRQTARDDFVRQERERYLDTLMGLIKTITVVGERLEAMEDRAQERQVQVMEKLQMMCTSMDLMAKRGTRQ